MRYEYDDSFVVSSMEDILEKTENEAYIEITDKLGISDEYYIEKLTKAKVYMLLCRKQLESEGMRDKFDAYKADFDFYLRESKSSIGGIGGMAVGRG